MNNNARMYRAEILRAVLGAHANTTQAADVARLNQIAERLAECDTAHAALQAKGYGTSGMPFIELVRSVPDRVRGKLANLFRGASTLASSYSDVSEASEHRGLH